LHFEVKISTEWNLIFVETTTCMFAKMCFNLLPLILRHVTRTNIAISVN